MLARTASFVILLVLLIGPASAGDGIADRRALRVGLLPTVASLSLLRLYDPLRLHLQETLDRPVELFTAVSFPAFWQDILDESFDIIVPASHFGVVAAEHGYLPLFRYRLELRPQIVVPKNSAIADPRQLAGKRILTANQLTAISVVAVRWLEEDYHLIAGRDYQLVEASNHSTAIRAVALGDADAAISSLSVIQQVPEDIRAKIDRIECRLLVPHQFTMAHRRLGADTIERLRAALAAFPTTERGRAFFAAGGFQGYVPLMPKDIEEARPYAELVKAMIGERK